MNTLSSLFSGLLLLWLLQLSAFCNDDRVYHIAYPQFIPELTQEDIIDVADSGSFDEFYLEAVISSNYYYISIRIYPDGVGRLYESLHTIDAKDRVSKDESAYEGLDNYVRMVKDLPSGEYTNYYKFNITKENILSLLRDLGDGTVPFNEDDYGGGGFGHGIGFVIDLYLNGKAASYIGEAYELEDINVEIRSWIEDVLIPKLKENAEEIDGDEYNSISHEGHLNAEMSFVEIY